MRPERAGALRGAAFLLGLVVAIVGLGLLVWRMQRLPAGPAAPTNGSTPNAPTRQETSRA